MKLKGLAMTVVSGASVLVLAGCAGGVSSGGEAVSFVGWGGTIQDAQTEAWSDPFAEENGVTVLSDGPLDYSKVETQVQTGNVSWDVITPEPYWAVANCGTLLEPIDTSIVDTSKMPEGTVSECAVPAFLGTYMLAYDEKKFPNGLTSWADFFDTAKFPGPRAVYNQPTTGVLELALLADGVRHDELYPLDIDRAIAKLKTLGSDLVFFDTGAQQQQMIESGDVAALLAWGTRLDAANENGAAFTPVWKDHFQYFDALSVVKGSAQSELAMKYIAYATSGKGQESLGALTPYSPVTSDAVPTSGGTPKPLDDPAIRDQGIVLDNQFYAEHSDELFAKWNDFTSGY